MDLDHCCSYYDYVLVLFLISLLAISYKRIVDDKDTTDAWGTQNQERKKSDERHHQKYGCKPCQYERRQSDA